MEECGRFLPGAGGAGVLQVPDRVLGMPLLDVRLNVRQRRPPRAIVDFLQEAGQRVEEFIANRPVRISGFVPSDFAEVYCVLEAVADQGLATGDVFCEWGSGFGVVAMMAALLEYQACGIEIERSLVDGARMLAEDFDLPVDFVHGSFVPPGGESIVEEFFGSEDSWLTSYADDAYARLGLSPLEFDVVYAFPWPGEEDVITELFDEFAAMGSLLLTYGQIEGVRVRRKVVRA